MAEVYAEQRLRRSEVTMREREQGASAPCFITGLPLPFAVLVPSYLETKETQPLSSMCLNLS
jgi:hypothetical protein